MSNASDPIDYRSLIQQSYLALNDMQARLDAIEQAQSEPIAIIGMGCHFPGGVKNPADFWELLRTGRDAITEVPAERWDADAYYDPDVDAPGKMTSRWGGFLDHADQFDANFFGIAPREAMYMDPQQRLLLEVTWEALEQAGQTVEQLAGSPTGVFVGVCNSDYSLIQPPDPTRMDIYVGTGTSHNIVAGRLSYVLDLRGPCVALDTACSSSLVALHLACQSLHSKECTLAIAGGVNMILSPLATITASKMHMLASDGRCKTFDSLADGFVRGEGCGVVVLKRLSQAQKDGDPILALVRGSAINQDGHSNGLTAPNVQAQQAVIRQALQQAHIPVEQMGFIETHGTGTSLGDPIEVEALRAVYGTARSDGSQCALGAVKTNLGHLEGAAGVAGLIKSVLALQNGEVPPNLHFRALNPNILLEQTPFVIPTTTQTWPVDAATRYAAVSSFGWSGTNAHIILEAPPQERAQAVEKQAGSNPIALLPLSARSPEALTQLALAYTSYLQHLPDDRLVDLCFTASQRRSHHPYRLAVLGRQRLELLEQLQAVTDASVDQLASRPAAAQRPLLVLVFPGQGSQWSGMGRDLLEQEPVFRQAMQRCAQVIEPLVSWSLLDVLADPSPEALAPIDVIQPVLFAIQVSLAALWHSWGITPDAVIGHSMGEVAAAHVAGILSLEDAARVICRRSRLLRRISGQGAMALVELSLSQAQTLIVPWADCLSVAVSNSPRSTVLSGDPTALASVLQQLETQGVFSRWVKVDVASHSPQVDSLHLDLLEALADLHPQVGLVPLYSTVTAAPIEGTHLDAAYWFNNLRQPVRFAEGVRQLLEQGYSHFVELSPHPILVPALEEGLRESGESGLVVASLRRQEESVLYLRRALAALYVSGVTPHWHHLQPTGHVVPLPAYPWQHERFWLPEEDDLTSTPQSTIPQRSYPGLPKQLFLGNHVEIAAHSGTHYWDRTLRIQDFPYLQDHCVQGMIVLPGSAYIEIALEAAQTVFDRSSTQAIMDVTLHNLLILDEKRVQKIQIELSVQSSDKANFQIFSCDTEQQDQPDPTNSVIWTLHARGSIHSKKEGLSEVASSMLPEEPPEKSQNMIAGEELYPILEQYGVQYGPGFQGIARLWSQDNTTVGQLQFPVEIAKQFAAYHVHPALLDVCFQVIGAGISPMDGQEKAKKDVYLPVGVGQIAVFGQPTFEDGHGGALWAYATVRRGDNAKIKEWIGDVVLRDEAGRVILKVDKLCMHNLDTVSTQPAQDALAEWFCELRWESAEVPVSVSTTPLSEPGEWLIFADEQGVAESLQLELQLHGARVVLVRKAEEFACLSENAYQLNPAHEETFSQILKQVWGRQEATTRHIVYLWGIEQKSSESLTASMVMHTVEMACVEMLWLVQALARIGWRDMPRFWLITQAAQSRQQAGENEAVNPLQTVLWGIGRSLAHEQPRWQCSLIDIGKDATLEDRQRLANLMQLPQAENQFLIRDGQYYVARLSPRNLPPIEEQQPPQIRAGDTPFRLETANPGILEQLVLKEVVRQVPGPGEVEVEVQAVGMNFIDVLQAMGIYPGQEKKTAALGIECAGRIVTVGEGVANFQVGDEVFALASNCMGTHVTTSISTIIPKPAFLSFEEAATIPSAFLTTYYALHYQGRLTRGERVLIHSASGGTGLAAVQIAQRAGAEIFATAGNPEKRAFLRSLGIQHVLDSRSLDFADQILELTTGQGVDVVLNSLTGEAMTRSLSILSHYGRFLEIGKKDIYTQGALDLSPFKKGLSYFAIDMDSLSKKRPDILANLWLDLLQAFEDGSLKPLSRKLFSIDAVQEAFHLMAHAKHIGKIVISFAEKAQASIQPAIRQASIFQEHETYLIAGGLRGLGLTVAQWMVEQGARHLVLIGRSKPTLEVADTLEKLRSTGAQIQVMQADVSSTEEMSAVLGHIRKHLPPLRGIIHSAVVLHDGILLNLKPEDFSPVLVPKIAGAWNLHQLTAEENLKFFILFSAGASLLGSPGQGNYAGANGFLDGLAAYRQQQKKPVLSINWGPWAEVGLAAAQANRGERMALRGFINITPAQGLAALERLIRYGNSITQIGVIPLNLRQLQQTYPTLTQAPLLTNIIKDWQKGVQAKSSETTLRRDLLACKPEERRHLLETHLRTQIAPVLRIAPARIDLRTALNTLGVDSLMALEIRNRLEDSTGLALQATLLWAHPTLAALVEHLAQKMAIPLEGSQPAEEARHVHREEIDRIADEVSKLSDDTVKNSLAMELDDLPAEFLL